MESEELADLLNELPNWGLDSSFVPGVRPIKLAALASALAMGGFCSVANSTPPDACVYEGFRDDTQEVDSALCFTTAPCFNAFDDPSVSSLPNSIEQHLRDRLFDAELRDSWRAKGFEPPKRKCYEKSFEVLSEIYLHSGMLPSKVVATKASSLLIEYRNSRIGSTLRLEVDNELDVVGVVSANDKSIESGDFESDFADRAIAIFQGRATAPPTT